MLAKDDAHAIVDDRSRLVYVELGDDEKAPQDVLRHIANELGLEPQAAGAR